MVVDGYWLVVGGCWLFGMHWYLTTNHQPITIDKKVIIVALGALCTSAAVDSFPEEISATGTDVLKYSPPVD
jgi:hypothetical protein